MRLFQLDLHSDPVDQSEEPSWSASAIPPANAGLDGTPPAASCDRTLLKSMIFREKASELPGVRQQPSVIRGLKLQRGSCLDFASIQYKSGRRNSQCSACDCVGKPMDILVDAHIAGSS